MKIEHSTSHIVDYNALLVDGKKYHYRAHAAEVANDLIRLHETGVKMEGTVKRFFSDYGMWPESQGIIATKTTRSDGVGYGNDSDAN